MLDITPQANMHMLFKVRSQIQNFVWTSPSALKTLVVQQDSDYSFIQIDMWVRIKAERLLKHSFYLKYMSGSLKVSWRLLQAKAVILQN